MNFDLFSQETLGANPAVPTADDIYSAYPRKQGKIAAMKAIAKAMHREQPSHLLERTQAFAAVVERWPAEAKPQFIPHPATFFNEGRYDDDPRTWERKGSNKGKAGFA